MGKLRFVPQFDIETPGHLVFVTSVFQLLTAEVSSIVSWFEACGLLVLTAGWDHFSRCLFLGTSAALLLELLGIELPTIIDITLGSTSASRAWRSGKSGNGIMAPLKNHRCRYCLPALYRGSFGTFALSLVPHQAKPETGLSFDGARNSFMALLLVSTVLHLQPNLCQFF